MTMPNALRALLLLFATAALAQACGDSARGRADDAGAAVAPDAESSELPETGGEDAGSDDEDAACEEPDGGLPDDIFCTGLYLKRDVNKRAPSAAAYTPGVTLWSDGAEKHRYLYLPPGARIDTSNMDSWRFPVGTKAWKEFRVDGALIETRLLWKRSEATWESGTYVWDSAGQTATLNTAKKGTLLPSGYEIPAPKDCDKCHHGGADKLLGVEAVAMALPTSEGVTLASLAEAGSLSHPPTQKMIVLPEDRTGKAAAALGYLHANCGMPCHSSRGLGEETQLVLRLRADEFWPTIRGAEPGNDAGVDAGIDAGLDAGVDAGLDAGMLADAGMWGPATVPMTDIYRATVGQRPTTASVIQAFPMAQRITPGVHDQSLIWLLSHVRGKYQMPPLVSHRVDDVGTQKLADWIDALRN